MQQGNYQYSYFGLQRALQAVLAYTLINIYTLIANWFFVWFRHAELILERGVALIQLHPNFIQGDNMYLVEEFFYAACEL